MFDRVLGTPLNRTQQKKMTFIQSFHQFEPPFYRDIFEWQIKTYYKEFTLVSHCFSLDSFKIYRAVQPLCFLFFFFWCISFFILPLFYATLWFKFPRHSYMGWCYGVIQIKSNVSFPKTIKELLLFFCKRIIFYRYALETAVTLS